MKKIFSLLLCAAACICAKAQTGPDVLIPKPVSYTVSAGSAPVGAPVKEIIGSRKFGSAIKDLPDFAKKEAYRLTIGPKNIKIEAEGLTGAFRARKTLEYLRAFAGEEGSLQCCQILDYPRFAHRGLMFDLSRHFYGKEFIFKELDLMALLKMNVLHLHLTDDAGWRLQIDGYPLLASRAAWRPQPLWADWDEQGHNYAVEGEPNAFGGYLTKEEAREIVAYAAERHITVIPEIELPGHSLEVLRAYPELACTKDGEPVFTSDLCPGNDLVIKMFQDILDEVMEIFPSEFIHIGGDEAGMGSWRECPRCQARMHEHNLADTDALQSWLIRQFDSYLASKGRRLLGWDEIMQGGLAPGAAVMSWRGTEQGIEAAAAGHDVIMSPTSFCYINRNQDSPLENGEFVGGYLPIAGVYAYDPAQGFSDTKHLLGLQGNLWAEHIPTVENLEYKAFPRAFALAEVGWTPQEQRDFEEFRPRAVSLVKYISSIGYSPFNLENEQGDRPESKVVLQHLASGAKVTYNIPWSPKYPAQGQESLTNGIQGGWTYVEDSWQGFESDMDVTIDLGQIKTVNFIGAHFLANLGDWVGLPQRVEISISTDGKDFVQLPPVICQVIAPARGSCYLLLGSFLDNASVKVIRFKAMRTGRLHEDWIFTDEIIVK